jgi:hypothetical protein
MGSRSSKSFSALSCLRITFLFRGLINSLGLLYQLFFVALPRRAHIRKS